MTGRGWVRAEPATSTEPKTAAQHDQLVRAQLRADRTIFQAGGPVWVEFSLTNLTDEPLTLRIPEPESLNSQQPADGDALDAEPAMGLPLHHVFSGGPQRALTITDKEGVIPEEREIEAARRSAAFVKLAPRGSAGVRIDLTRYYEALKRPGDFTLVWRPYHGEIESDPLRIQLLPERQAVVLTDYGKITIRFYYEEAPRHVQNFLELAAQKLYDGLTFHRVAPGGIIQGGEPRGDG